MSASSDELPFELAYRGHGAARTCGFAGELVFQSIGVTAQSPARRRS